MNGNFSCKCNKGGTRPLNACHKVIFTAEVMQLNLGYNKSCLLTSKMKEVFNGVDILQAKPLEARFKWAKAPLLSPSAKDVLKEPCQGQRAAGNDAERGQEAGKVYHFGAALVIVGRDGITAAVAA